MDFLQWARKVLSRLNSDDKAASKIYPLLNEAHAHLVAEEYDKAQAKLLQALNLRNDLKDPAVIDYLLTSLGATWLLTDRYKEGIAFFSGYIERYSSDSAAFCERAAVRWYAGQLEEAIRDYSHALELKPNDILSLSGRGQVLAELGQNERAIQDLNLALETLQGSPVADPSWSEWYEQIEAFIHNGRGVALAALGENGSAMSEFEVSIAKSPENAWVYYNRARIYDHARNFEKARPDYQAALTKRSPALNPIKKEHAQTRLREIPSQS
jgi:tetratricopeptide (TPR) repeat protein